MTTLAERIKSNRALNGQTIKQVIAKADISEAHYINIEQGRTKNPGIDTVKRIAEALNVDPSYLAYGQVIEQLPPAEPEREAGVWIPGREISTQYLGGEVLNVDYENFTCSCCGLILDALMYNFDGEPFYKHCPGCGKRMTEIHHGKLTIGIDTGAFTESS